MTRQSTALAIAGTIGLPILAAPLLAAIMWTYVSMPRWYLAISLGILVLWVRRLSLRRMSWEVVVAVPWILFLPTCRADIFDSISTEVSPFLSAAILLTIAFIAVMIMYHRTFDELSARSHPTDH